MSFSVSLPVKHGAHRIGKTILFPDSKPQVIGLPSPGGSIQFYMTHQTISSFNSDAHADSHRPFKLRRRGWVVILTPTSGSLSLKFVLCSSSWSTFGRLSPFFSRTDGVPLCYGH